MILWNVKYCYKRDWFDMQKGTNTLAVKMAVKKERLVRFGFYDLAETYQ